MQRRIAFRIKLIQTCTRLLQQGSNQCQHGRLTRHVQRDLAFGGIHNGTSPRQFRHTRQRSVFVVFLTTIYKSTSRIIGRWCQCIGNLFEMSGCPRKHGRKNEGAILLLIGWGTKQLEQNAALCSSLVGTQERSEEERGPVRSSTWSNLKPPQAQK